MPLSFTATQLLASVRRQAMVPNTSTLGTAQQDVLDEINQAILIDVYPEVTRLREEYFVRQIRIPLLATTSVYRVPKRAFLNKLRSFYYVDTGGQRSEVTPADPDALHIMGNRTSDRVLGLIVQDNDMTCVPRLEGASGFLEIHYFFRPSALALTVDVRQISVVDTATKTVKSATTWPASWAIGTLLDIHSNLSGSENKVFDVTIATIDNAVAPYTITFVEAIDGTTYGSKSVEVTDWVALAGECAIPPLPQELQPLLVDAGAIALTNVLGDKDGMTLNAQRYERRLKSLRSALEQRTEGKPRRLTGRRGFLNSGRWLRGAG